MYIYIYIYTGVSPVPTVGPIPVLVLICLIFGQFEYVYHCLHNGRLWRPLLWLFFSLEGQRKQSRHIPLPQHSKCYSAGKCNDIGPPSNPYQSLALFFSAISWAIRNTSIFS